MSGHERWVWGREVRVEFRVSLRVESPGFGVEGCVFAVFRVKDLVSSCPECSVSVHELVFEDQGVLGLGMRA